MRRRISGSIGVLLCLLSTRPVLGHHAFSAEFDADKPITLVGKVTRTEWINPHSWVYIDVKGENGTVENWMIELGTVGTLVRAGLTKNLLPIGTEIKISGFRSKDGTKKANGREASFADGRSFGLGSSINQNSTAK